MTSAVLYRLSGLALVIGMFLSLASSLVGGVAFPDNSDPATAANPLSVALNLLGVIGTIVLLLGLPGLYARSAREGGLMWLVGVVLIAITGMLFGIFSGLVSVLIFPYLASQAPDLIRNGPPPAFFPFFIIATLANLFGAILMGIPMLTRGIFPRWCGFMMLAEAVLAISGFAVNGPSSAGLVGQIVNVLGPVPLFVVLGWAGYELWSGKAATRSVVAGSVVAQPA